MHAYVLRQCPIEPHTPLSSRWHARGISLGPWQDTCIPAATRRPGPSERRRCAGKRGPGFDDAVRLCVHHCPNFALGKPAPSLTNKHQPECGLHYQATASTQNNCFVSPCITPRVWSQPQPRRCARESDPKAVQTQAEWPTRERGSSVRMESQTQTAFPKTWLQLAPQRKAVARDRRAASLKRCGDVRAWRSP